MNITINKIETESGEPSLNWTLQDKKSKKEFKILSSFTFEESKEIVTKETKSTFIIMHLDVDWWEGNLTAIFHLDKIQDIEFSLQFDDWENWDKPWSMSSFANYFQKNVEALENKNIEYCQDDPDSMLNGFGLTYYPTNNWAKIKIETDKILNIIENIVAQTNKDLLDALNPEAVLTYFQFPDEIKAACKQYLVYFTQFIADMGIQVDTELKEELNRTLFKIIPKDKEDSLDRIREALNIYLNAPNTENFDSAIATQNDIASKQWEANIFHLKAQLSLASSIIQAKETTIEMLQLSNYQYKQLHETHSSKKDIDKEEVIKGIVSVKKFEGKGFTIDFAEIFRRLKRSIKG